MKRIIEFIKKNRSCKEGYIYSLRFDDPAADAAYAHVAAAAAYAAADAAERKATADIVRKYFTIDDVLALIDRRA